MKLCLRFHESEIGYWATRYIETQRKSDLRKEREMVDLRCEVQGRGFTTDELYQIVKIAKWKSPRRVNLTLDPSLTGFGGCQSCIFGVDTSGRLRLR